MKKHYLGIELFLGTDYSVCTRSILWQNEFWKDAIGYDGFYQISTLGRVKSKKRKITIILSRHRTKGYCKVNLVDSFGRIKRKIIHRELGKLFIPNENNKPFINHKNSIRHDCRLQNLEWCTPKENVNHAWQNGKCETARDKAKLGVLVLNQQTGIYYNTIKEAHDSIGNNSSYEYFKKLISKSGENKTSFLNTKLRSWHSTF